MRDGAPAAGSDFTLDDHKTVGFNGSPALFDAKFLGHRKCWPWSTITAMTRKFPDDYVMPL
jgi:hypothetical protein